MWAAKGRTFARPCTSVSREASIRAISGSGTFNGRRLTTEYTERPAAVTEHTERVNRDFGIQCFQCAAKRLPCVLWIVCGGFTTDNTDTCFARHGSSDPETSISCFLCRMYMRRLCRTGGDTWQCVNGRMRGNEERELAAIYLLGETGMLNAFSAVSARLDFRTRAVLPLFLVSVLL